MARARSFLEYGNLTRGSYGIEPIPRRGRLERDDRGDYFFTPDPDGPVWACWDPDFGWLVWPPDDVVEDDTEL